MANIVRYFILILLSLSISVTALLSDDGCLSAINLDLNDISDDQYIDQPFVVGHSGGEALYFKIVLTSNGNLSINTTDPTGSDKVDTYGRLLDSNCDIINSSDTQIHTNPRYFRFDEELEAGTYYLRVHNEISIDDTVSENDTGYFRIENSFYQQAPDKRFSIYKESPSSINSGSEIIYAIVVKNEGSDSSTAVKIIDPIPTTDDGSEKLEFVGAVESSDWSCSEVGDNIECSLNDGIMNYQDYKTLKLKYRAAYKEYDRYVKNTTLVEVTYSDGSLNKSADERSVLIKKAIPSILVEKSAQDFGHTNIDSIVEGGEFYFHIYVENNGTKITDSNVKVTDTFSGDFEFVGFENDNDWNCNYDSSQKRISCILDYDLVVDDADSFDIKVKAVGDPDNAEHVANSAIVSADTVMGSISDSDGATITIVKKEPKINIKKVRSKENVVKGHSAYYTITVDAIGSNVDLTNIKVEDLVPSELKLTSVSGDGWSCSKDGNKAVCIINSLAKGETANSIRVDVDAEVIKDGIINDVNVTTDEGAAAMASESINVVAPTPSIRIEKSAPASVLSLQTFDYTFRVENNGTEPITGITFTDNLDTRLILSSDWNSNINAPWSCTKSGHDISCSFDSTLQPHDSTTFNINVKSPFVKEDIDINNTAIIKGTSAGVEVRDEDTFIVNVSEAKYGIILGKFTNKESLYSGEKFRYSIVVTNSGDVELNNIVVTDKIPEILDGNFTVSSGDFNCSESSGTDVVCKLDSLAKYGDLGYKKVFYIDVTAPIVSSPTTVTNSTSTTSVVQIPDEPDEVVEGNNSVDVTILPPASDLSFTKSSSKDNILEKDSFDYIIKVENRAIVDEYNLTITDEINSSFLIDSIDSGDWNCTQNDLSVSCILDVIKAQTSSEIKIKVKAPDTIEDDVTISNHAHLVSARDSKDAYDDVNLVSSNSALSIFMSSENPVYSSNIYRYTIEVSNNSGEDIEKIDLNETLPTEIEFDHFESDGWSCSYDSSTRGVHCDNNNQKLLNSQDKTIYMYVKAPSSESNVTNTIYLNSSLDDHERNATTITHIENKVAKLIYSKATTDKKVVKEGDDFTYLIKIKNDGKAPESDINATNIKVVLNLDENITYLSHSAPDWNCSYGSETLTCILPYLEYGLESPDLNVTVNAPIHKQVVSEANLTATQLPDSEAKTISMSVDVREVVSLDMSVDIDDGLDVVETESNYFYHVVVKNRDENKIAQDVVLDINTTSDEDFELEDYQSVEDWECEKVGKLLRCNLYEPLMPDSESILDLEVTAPNVVTKVEVNASLYSEFVDDTNPANNSDYDDVNVIETDYDGNSPRDFMKVPLHGKVDLNIFGDLLTIGNQSICEKSTSVSGKISSIILGECKEPTTVYNDGTYQTYINVESGDYKTEFKNATKAKLNIEPTDEIVWAGLYWMGRLDKKRDSKFIEKRSKAHKVYFRADSNSSGYIEVKAQRAATAIDNSGNFVTVDKFNFINGDYYFDYQGMADVTSYVKANRGGYYWVADVQTSEGRNLSAGWNLVVIVQDMQDTPTRDLKNITLFDGFQGVWKNSRDPDAKNYPDEVNQTVSGFLTPQVGEIKSSLVFFGFEGDEEIDDFIQVSDSSGVLHPLTNSINPSNDVVNSTISKNGTYVTDRLPNLKNTSGIDVDMFDLGDSGLKIIQNGQTSANISIGSNGDRFFLGMFGFSTNLYDPVCYMQKFYNQEFTAELGDDSEIYLGDKIGIEVEFRNKEVQTLENMHVYSQIDKNFKEDQDSFMLKNVNEGSFTQQKELFKFASVEIADKNLTEVQTAIGDGASSSSGGDLKSGESVYIRYNVVVDQLNDDNLTHNIYLASYEPTTSKKIQIPRCSGVDRNLTFLKNVTQGFEITHNGGVTDGYVDGTVNEESSNPSNEQHLFTQVQDENFTVDIVALDDRIDNKVTEYKGVVKLDLLDMSGFDGTKENCKYLPLIGDSKFKVFDENKIRTISYNYNNAKKEVGFRVRYLVDKYNRHIWNDNRYSDDLTINGIKDVVSQDLYGDKRCMTECGVSDEACYACVYKHIDNGGFALFSCSSDRFAVKPKSVILDMNDTTLVGGREYTLILDANATGYSEHNVTSSSGSLEYNLTNPSSCISSLNGNLFTGSQKLEFKNGEANLTDFKYDNIGQIKLTYIDSSWTIGDQNLSDLSMSDCIVGSSSNTHDSSGRVGCDVSGEKFFDFAPARFINKILDFRDFKNSFTYISNEKNVAAPIQFMIEAVLDDNTTATNFTRDCYATDVNYTISLNGASSFIPLYFDLNNSILKSTSIDGEFNTTEGNFTNGIATITVGLNAKREIDKPINPFIINSKDINISVDDNGTYSIHGKDFINVVDKNATFYYGRCHVPDIETASTDIDVTFYYEVYCKDCDRAKFSLSNGSESVDSINWVIANSNHTSASQGSFSALESKNGMTFSNITFSGCKISLGTISAPHSDKITYKPSPWLLYSKFNSSSTTDSFNINVVSTSTNWSGKGEIGMTVDNNLSKRSTKKLEW